MFSPTREQVRDLFFATWQKYRRGQAVEGIETLALEVIVQHPEYHAVLEDPERYRDRDYLPDAGQTNPFLHMSLHLALREQLSIDQPAGIRARHAALLAALGDAHDAEHAMLDCLAETVWQAQRQRAAPDPALYLSCLDARTKKKPG